MLKRLGLKRKASHHPAPRLPKGRRIYAIGDMHGQYDCLMELLELIAEHQIADPSPDPIIIGLGDYVDRGLGTRQVVERLIQLQKEDPTILLRGNHERALLSFMDGTMPYDVWVRWGGAASLKSYGITPCPSDSPTEIEKLRLAFIEAVPTAHRDFLRRLKLMHEEGGYLFVHAGVRPGVDLNAQTEEDLLMIRGEFLDAPVTGEHTVIHGHTILSDTPHIRERSIGIDTGAYASGRLTCIVLEEDRYEFLSTNMPREGAEEWPVKYNDY